MLETGRKDIRFLALSVLADVFYSYFNSPGLPIKKTNKQPKKYHDKQILSSPACKFTFFSLRKNNEKL